MTGQTSLYVEQYNFAMLDQSDVAEIGNVCRAGTTSFNAARNVVSCNTGTLALSGVRADFAEVRGLEVAHFWLAGIWKT